jgi:hypothetical protein
MSLADRELQSLCNLGGKFEEAAQEIAELREERDNLLATLRSIAVQAERAIGNSAS